MADAPLPRAVLFDAAGTLMYPVPPVVEVYARVAGRWGVVAHPEDVARRYAAAWARRRLGAMDDHGRTSEAQEQAWWRGLVGEVFPDAAAIDRIFTELWEHFAQPHHWRLYGDVPATLARLQAAGVPWYIASNFDARLHNIVRGHPALAACAGLFISSRVGFRKPAAGFFSAVERALARPPHELILVGDDLECDYLAARRRGWRAVLIDRLGRTPHADSISRLDELSGALWAWPARDAR
jgi:putative hydrolase of the HAD superfamily